jgi:S1-C subfamily serine protease
VSFALPVVHDITSGMPAENSGLMAGDVITAVDGEPIERSEAGAAKLVALIGESQPDEAVTLTVDRGGRPLPFPSRPKRRRPAARSASRWARKPGAIRRARRSRFPGAGSTTSRA